MADERVAKEIYDKSIETRTQYKDRAEEIASLSIPYLMPPQGYSSSSSLDDSLRQSDMATNINSLTSKIVMNLFPTATSSFRLEPDAESDTQLQQEGNEEAREAIIIQLANATSLINRELEAQDIRPQVFGFIRDLVAVGPVIIEKIKDSGGIKWHGLASIGVMLDDKFEPYEMSILEVLTKLPDGITVNDEADTYELYTSVAIDQESDGRTWIMKQSIGSEPVGEEKTFTDETLPFQYIGWSIAKGDTYHRPYSEQMLGDIRSLNALSQVLVDGSVIASKALIFVDPRGGRTRMRDVSDSDNGDIIEGRSDDVTAFQLNKNFDFQVPMELKAEIKASLESAYLVNKSASRQAERVTATEVSFMAQELETQLAGIYSIMSTKVSKRIITWIMQDLGMKKGSTIDLNVITGLDALSKMSEAQNLDAFMGTISNLGYNASVKEAEVVLRYAGYYNVNPVGLIKTQQEIAAERQAQQQAEMQQQAGGAMAESAGNAAGEAAIVEATQQQGEQQ